MTAFETRSQNGNGSTNTITDLRKLNMGDRVVFGDRTRPVDVVDKGVRTVTDTRLSKTIKTPVVRVQGNWDGAVSRVLAHRINRWEDGIVLREIETIVACEGTDLERGEIVTIRRVSSEKVTADA